MLQGVKSQIHSGTNGEIALRCTVYGDFCPNTRSAFFGIHTFKFINA